METILVAVGPTDENRTEKLTATVADIAGPAEATVALAHVYESEEYERSRDRLDFDPDSEVTPDVIARRDATIRALEDDLETAGIETAVYGRLANGDSVATRLVDLAESLDVDLVVVGGRDRSPTGKAVFGSTAQDVLLNSPAPVLFVRSE